MQNSFFTLPLWNKSYPYLVSYCLFVFLNIIFISIITSYINEKCCKNNVGLIILLLVITSLFVTSVISRLVCINYQKKATENNYNNNDDRFYYEQEYAEV